MRKKMAGIEKKRMATDNPSPISIGIISRIRYRHIRHRRKVEEG